MTELQKRVATGLTGAAAMITLLAMGGRVGVGLVTAIISLAMLWEFVQIVFNLADATEKRYALLSLAWLVLVTCLLLGFPEFEILSLSFLIVFMYFLFSAGRHEGAELAIHFQELALAAMGILYLVFLPLFLQRLNGSPNGVHWVIIFFFINWAGDTGAYFGGKKFGRVKLYPLISPKKTREGALAGLASGWVVTVLYKLIFFRGMPWAAAMVTPLVVGFMAQVGDLCESFLKRSFDKKDSSSILPGHGGFLDRFDGVVFSLPVMYACVRLLGGS